MTRALSICGLGYVLGALAFGCVRAVDLWDSMGMAALSRAVAVDGLLWPISFINWIT